jgi:hypothetical protein
VGWRVCGGVVGGQYTSISKGLDLPKGGKRKLTFFDIWLGAVVCVTLVGVPNVLLLCSYVHLDILLGAVVSITLGTGVPNVLLLCCLCVT